MLIPMFKGDLVEGIISIKQQKKIDTIIDIINDRI